MSTFTPEQLAEIEAKLATAKADAISAATAVAAQYAKADSALHVFIREHSQAAFNVALFGGIAIGALLGRLSFYVVK